MKRLLFCLTVFSGTGTVLAQGTDPTPIVQEILLTDVVPVRYGDVAMGDYDNDHDLDLLLTGARGGPSSPNPSTVLYRILGDTTLLVTVDSQLVEVDAVHAQPAASAAFSRLWKSSAAWADYNNDGLLDLALMGVDLNGTVVTEIYAQSASGGAFSPRYRIPNPVHTGDLIWGDVDNDTDLDLIVCGFTEDSKPLTMMYANDVRAGNSFQPVGTAMADVGQCSIDLGDYDIDGDLDVLITGAEEDGATLTHIYNNNGWGQFSRYFIELQDFLFASAVWGDFDADGFLDIFETGALLSPLLLDGAMEYYRYDTTNVTFASATVQIAGAFQGDPVTGRYLGGLAKGDLNNDGYLDLVVTGAESPRTFNATQLYLSDGGHGIVKSEVDKFEGGFRGGAVIADYDVDRDVDVIIFGEYPNLAEAGPRIRILRNNLPFGKRAPTPPEAIDADVQGRDVVLSWTPGQDRQTPINALTHNVRIGTSPGAGDVLAPMAHLVTGRRRITARGNVGSGRTWTFRNLSPGTYYWAIQALDFTYYGSVWSQEGTFTIQ